MPCCASAGAIGGAGLALPALIANVPTALTFFDIVPLSFALHDKTVRRPPAHRCSTRAAVCCPSIPMLLVPALRLSRPAKSRVQRGSRVRRRRPSPGLWLSLYRCRQLVLRNLGRDHR